MLACMGAKLYGCNKEFDWGPEDYVAKLHLLLTDEMRSDLDSSSAICQIFYELCADLCTKLRGGEA